MWTVTLFCIVHMNYRVCNLPVTHLKHSRTREHRPQLCGGRSLVHLRRRQTIIDVCIIDELDPLLTPGIEAKESPLSRHPRIRCDIESLVKGAWGRKHERANDRPHVADDRWFNEFFFGVQCYCCTHGSI